MAEEGMKHFETKYGEITDERLNDLRSRIGVPIPKQEFGPPIPAAHVENVRLWAWGIGDDNPLYTKEEYGAKSRWKAMITPPSILLGMDPHRLGYMGGLPGSHSLFAGINWEWFRPIRLDQKIDCVGKIGMVQEKEDSKLTKRTVKVRTDTDFFDQEGNKVGRFEQFRIRFERRKAREKGSLHKEIQEEIPKQYTPQEIEEIAEQYRQEVRNRRGATPRYWEDVNVGDELPKIIKGPLTISAIIAFTAAVRPVHLMRGHRMLFQLVDKHPGTGIPNYFGMPDPPISVHWEHQQAVNASLPTAYDFGMERTCWASHLMTDWMGDEAFLKALRTSFKAPNYLGDLQTFTGEVTEKLQEGNLSLVKIAYRAINQRNTITTQGTALVALPSRKNGIPAEEDLANLIGCLDMI